MDNYKDLKNSVQSIVNKIDPENLMDVAPEDEYNDYVDRIVSLIINNSFSKENLSEIWKAVDPKKVEEMYLELKELK